MPMPGLLCFALSNFSPPSLLFRGGCNRITAPQPIAGHVGIRTRTSMAAGDEISSLKNPRVKEARALLNRRHREKTGKILLEGRRLIQDALQQHLQPLEFFYTTHALERSYENLSIQSIMRTRGAKDYLVPDAVIRSFSATVNPQGLVGIFEKPSPNLPNLPTFSLICDQVHDPGNLGSLLRCAAAAGVHFVALTPGCADPWGLKALRAGMGAQFRLSLCQGMSWPSIVEYMKRSSTTIRIAEGCAEKDYADVDWSVPCALVVGSESIGPSEAALSAGHERVAIPMSDDVESLNVAMAGAIILFEAKRQRNHIPPMPQPKRFFQHP